MMKYVAGSNSQAAQESFVLNVLNNKRNGFYVEIGGYHAKDLSNTFLLETEYQWKGVSLEIDEQRARAYNESRKNPCLSVDATTFDLGPYFSKNKWPQQIDYLQVDIEPAYQTLAALLNLPKDYRFSVITFEHDLYAGGDNAAHQETAYQFLSELGYKRVVHNLLNFEDWYVDPLVVDCEFLGANVEPHNLFSW
jgi:hypothetical protein